MKKLLAGIILGMVTTAAIFGLYTRENMIDLSKVNHIEETTVEWNIVLENGNIYTIEKQEGK